LRNQGFLKLILFGAHVASYGELQIKPYPTVKINQKGIPELWNLNMDSERIPRITVRKYFRAFAAWALCPVFSGISGSPIGQVKGLTEPNYHK